jgi:isochorismate synthase
VSIDLALERRLALGNQQPIAAAFDPIAIFSAADDAVRTLWYRPAAREALVGLGSAWAVTASGPERFQRVKAEVEALTRAVNLTLIGGFSFDPMREPTAAWRGFPPARVILPERLYRTANGRSSLSRHEVLRARPPQRNLRRESPGGLGEREWREVVGAVADGIRQHTLGVTKVVLARARQGQPTRTLEQALRTLAANYPTCTIFAFADTDACFLGASPERLVNLRQGIASTEALAGSFPRGRTPAEDVQLSQRLREDAKELTEHAIVADALRQSLAQVCTRVIADAEPRVRKLPNVQHLVTRFRGTLAPACNLLDVIERLHPTPATGGAPRHRALELIREHEALDRGWYAAPLGWMDTNGDGEFVVGLRSALVRRDTANLFAGCGIVADSHPGTEVAEWGWKLRPMLEALGIRE